MVFVSLDLRLLANNLGIGSFSSWTERYKLVLNTFDLPLISPVLNDLQSFKKLQKTFLKHMHGIVAAF